MAVIVPQFVADEDYSSTDGKTRAELLSSTITATAYTAFAQSHSYSADDVVKYQDTEGIEQGIWKTYICIAGYTSGATEAADNPYINSTNWSSQGATERYKMFDYLTLTKTTDTDDITVNLHCYSVNSISFLNVQADSITIKIYKGSDLTDKTAGNLVDEVTIDLTQQITDWYSYFFDDFDYIRDISTPLEIDLYYNTVLEITFTQLGSEDCYVGQCLVGRSYSLGTMRYGVSTGIKDYSKKDTDPVFGYTYLAQGNYKKTIEADLLIKNDDLNLVNSILTQLRGIPTVWQFNPTDLEYDNLLVYGFFSNFSIVMRYLEYSECSLSIEGLI